MAYSVTTKGPYTHYIIDGDRIRFPDAVIVDHGLKPNLTTHHDTIEFELRENVEYFCVNRPWDSPEITGEEGIDKTGQVDKMGMYIGCIVSGQSSFDLVVRRID